MEPQLHGLGRALILFGVVLAGMGLLLLLVPRIPWLGRLPGDILIERNRLAFYFPLSSCLIASLFLSLVWWCFSRLR